MFVFFLKMQNTQCGYHCGFSSLMDPLVPKMRRLSLEDSGQGAAKVDSSTGQRVAKKMAAGRTDIRQ
jgi:hypothetical protein